ncbi:MAG: ribokinase [Oscillospiraceae bacterium]|nr:ribokinase [Oscillospiraceae bacterium]
MKQKVTVFGSFVVDLMARAPHLPTPGETVRGSLFKQGAGGKGFNQGIAAHKAGGEVVMITKVGNDSLAKVAYEAMDAVGLSKEHVFVNEEVATGTALVCVGEDSGQNQIIIVPGACNTITEEDLAQVRELIESSAYVLLQLEVNQDANERVAQMAKEKGVRVIINTAPYQPMEDEFLKGAYLVTPNEVEAEEFTGIAVKDLESADRAAAVFFAKGVENVLITLGSRGVYLATKDRSEIIPGFRVDAIDTTGAGDAFNGGLLAALSEGKELRQAIPFAQAVAALSVQRLGTTASMPTREEIDGFLSQRS